MNLEAYSLQLGD
uniref:Uncharacterized protein n=1 Tax=Oryza punctata TaxID=4537 RepID=A0A0E0LCP2_ORYPU